MDINDTSAVLAELAKLSGGSEVRRVHHFRFHRERSDGRFQTVDVEITEAGLDVGRNRWAVVATPDIGQVATGNPEADLSTALALVHWDALDRDEGL